MAWTANTPLSVSNLNKASVLVSPGVSVVGSAPVTGQLISVTADGGGFLNETVLVKTALGYKLVTLSKHYHDADTDAAGGRLQDILRRSHDALVIDRRNSIVNHWLSEGSGGSATDDSNGSINLTATTTNNWRGIRQRGIPPDWAKYFRLQMQLMYPSATTSNIARAGVDMENLGAANDNNKKMGIEGCASTGTNWRIVSADGSSRTQIDASVALVQAQADSYAIENSPGVAAKFSYNGGTYVDKTNTLPGSGAVTKSNVLMAGVQTSNTTAKTLYVWGVYFTGFAHSTGWVH